MICNLQVCMISDKFDIKQNANEKKMENPSDLDLQIAKF